MPQVHHAVTLSGLSPSFCSVTTLPQAVTLSASEGSLREALRPKADLVWATSNVR